MRHPTGSLSTLALKVKYHSACRSLLFCCCLCLALFVTLLLCVYLPLCSLTECATAVEDVPVNEIYQIALYFSIETMTSVGYGDVLPQSMGEVACTTIMMIIGACVMTFMLGSVASMVASLDMAETVSILICRVKL